MITLNTSLGGRWSSTVEGERPGEKTERWHRHDNVLRELRHRFRHQLRNVRLLAMEARSGRPERDRECQESRFGRGDEVLFKAGVVYQGTIDIAASGTANKPIRYEGTGWGTGQAIMSGLTSVQLKFTVDPSNPKLSVATLPAGMIPTGLSTGVLSAQDNIVEIDGNVASMSNNSTSSNQYFPDLGAVSMSASQMTGSGSTWTFTDPKLGAELAGLTTAQIDNMIFRTYVAGNMELNMTVTGFNPIKNSLSLSGSYAAPPTGSSYTLLNDRTSPLRRTPTRNTPSNAIRSSPP
jgi:signal peptidase I